MTETAPPAESTPTREDKRHKLHLEELALAGLAVLSLVGIAVSDFSANRSFVYWVAMAPVFATVSIFTGWSRARKRGEAIPRIMIRQALHWGVMPIAVYLVYLMQATGRLNREDAGLVALLALALTTFLAGVHFDWRLAVVGAALAVAALFAALVEEFFWVLLIVAVPVIAILLWRSRRPQEPPRDGVGSETGGAGP